MIARIQHFTINSISAMALLPLLLLLIFSVGTVFASELQQGEQLKKDIASINALPAKLTFNKDIKPILEKRCVVCHGCYDAPCQLKLSAIEGITRGANKLKLYNKTRLTWQQPSRLFIDASTTREWRDMEFFGVLNEGASHTPEANLEHSLLYKMLSLKQINPLPEAGMLPEDLDVSLEREQVCTTLDKFDAFAKAHPLWGMPYALPNLSNEEYALLVKWLSQGDTAAEAKQLSPDILAQVRNWEDFFNGSGNKQQLVSRYIYEHLVLGHVYFQDDNGHFQNDKDPSGPNFFRLVRSRTPSGVAVDEIASIRPYDDPDEDVFYYRLRSFSASIVDKNHIVYELSAARMQRYRELFLQPDYQVEKLPGYAPGESPNFFVRAYRKILNLFGLNEASTPFEIFADIPPQARYQFLLDDARFFINGFIKGPVCRGQSALSSIEDHFWVFFLKPKNPSFYRQHGLDSEFLRDVDKDLHLPTELADTSRLFAAWIKYWPQEQAYMRAKTNYYQEQGLPQLDIHKAVDEFVWDGRRKDGSRSVDAALTIFRHFDSASVHSGLYGESPETAWVIDYPVFERLHYLLVAGFNPFGTMGHQLGARLYMGFLRIEGEDNFLYFLPREDRKRLYEAWHEIDRKTTREQRQATRAWLEVDSVNGYEANPARPFYHQPKQEFFEILKQHTGYTAMDATDLNRCSRANCFTSPADRAMQRLAHVLRGKRLQIFPETSYLRVRGVNGHKDVAYTLIHNKSYRTDTFAKEDNDRPGEDMKDDTLTIMRGLAGSYPNFFFDVSEADLDAFVAACVRVMNRDDYEQMVTRFGIRRTDPRFWDVSDWIQDQHARAQPVDAGILDLSRYKDR